jgi:hypothetical protein
VVILHGRAFLSNHKHGKGYKSNLVSEESQNILDWPFINYTFVYPSLIQRFDKVR